MPVRGSGTLRQRGILTMKGNLKNKKVSVDDGEREKSWNPNDPTEKRGLRSKDPR